MRQLDLFGGMFADEPEVKHHRKQKAVHETALPGDVPADSVVAIAEEVLLHNTPVSTLDETVITAVDVSADTFAMHSVHASDEAETDMPAPITVEEIIVAETAKIDTEEPTIRNNNAIVFTDGKIAVKIKAKVVEPVQKPEKVKPMRVPQKRGRKSIKEIDAEVDLIEIPEDEILFQKQYYPISEVAKWFRVNTSLVRFWENEFDILKPRKNRKGDRLFRPEDIKNLELIYQLLRQRKFTIEGAKEYIRSNKKKADVQLHLTNTLLKFRSFLLELRANLQS
jgi:DNA-binding transcriptional MerR regulator